MGSPSHHDALLHELAAFTNRVPLALDAAAQKSAQAAIIDTLAVALGALRHPAAIAGRRYARHSVVARGATLWGSGETVTAEAATLANGVPLRGYDYNDLYIGRSGGHPSDVVPGAIALAQWRGLSGATLLGGIALAYEAQLALFDTLELDAGGWDYPVVTALGATCGYARMLGLTEVQVREALAIVAVTHMVSDEVESGELNARGDLTMWKRFNGSNAARTALSACVMAKAGIEGAIRPFEGRTGMLSKLGEGNANTTRLFDLLRGTKALGRVGEVTFKRWPVGSRAQSAIQAALQAHASMVAQGADPRAARSVRVLADEQVYDHLLRRRADPFHPISRETADHSLPYIVCAAVLDGRVGTDAFEPSRVLDPGRQAFLSERVKVEVSAEISKGAAGGFLSGVEITDDAGRVHAGQAKAPPGHRLQPFSEAEFEQKLRENVEPLYGAARAGEMLGAVRALPSAASPDALCALLTVADGRRIEAAAA